MNVAVIGAGHVGAVTAAWLADPSYDVTVVEVAGPRLAEYQTGRVPFYEPGLDDLVGSIRAAGRLRVGLSELALGACRPAAMNPSASAVLRVRIGPSGAAANLFRRCEPET